MNNTEVVEVVDDDPEGYMNEDTDDEPDATAAPTVYENLGSKVRKVVMQKRKTAIAAFNAYLTKIKYQPSDFNQLSAAQLLQFQEVFGCFPDYLMRERKLSDSKSNQNYVSCIKTLIESRAPDSDILQGRWYSQLQQNIKKMYVEQAQSNKTTLTKDGNLANHRDLMTICRKLFTENTAQSISERNLICFEWYCCGRITEVTDNLTSDKFDAYFGNRILCMKGKVLRAKTYREDDVLFILHASDWLICPIHSFASLLACGDATMKLYPLIAANRGGHYVNDMLKRKFEEEDGLTPKLTSKCFRTGAATHLNEDPASKERNIILRLGHEMKSIETSYNYILGTSKTESQSARLMSGWSSPEFGGICPWMEAIPDSDHDAFTLYAADLIGCRNLKPNMVLLAAIILVLYYKKVSMDYPESLLLKKMNSKSVRKEQLQIWCDALNKEFLKLNAVYLPIETINDDATINVHDMKTFMTRTVEEQQNIRIIVQQQNEQLQQQCHELQRQNELLQALINAINSNYTTPSRRSTSNRSSLITSHFNTTSTDNNNNNNQTTSAEFPTEWLISRKSVCVGAFFQRWYKDEIYNVISTDDKEVECMNRFKRAITLFKHFLPDNAVLDRRPNTNSSSFRAWLLNLEELSVSVQDNAIAFCSRHRPTKNQVRQRAIMPYYEGIVRRLNELVKDAVDLPNPANVIDRTMAT